MDKARDSAVIGLLHEEGFMVGPELFNPNEMNCRVNSQKNFGAGEW